MLVKRAYMVYPYTDTGARNHARDTDPMQREGLGLLLTAAVRESCRPGDVLGTCERDGPHAVLIMPMTDGEAAARRLELIRSLWAGRMREQLQGEELPPLEALVIDHRRGEDAADIWQRIETWVARHA